MEQPRDFSKAVKITDYFYLKALAIFKKQSKVIHLKVKTRAVCNGIYINLYIMYIYVNKHVELA